MSNYGEVENQASVFHFSVVKKKVRKGRKAHHVNNTFKHVLFYMFECYALCLFLVLSGVRRQNYKP